MVRGRVGHYHFKVKKVLWQTLIIGIQTAVGALDPSHITKAGMIIQIMNYLNTLKAFAAALDESEVEVYDAVCEIVRSKAINSLVLEAKSASQEEVASLIQQTGGRVLPSQLKHVLDGLVCEGRDFSHAL